MDKKGIIVVIIDTFLKKNNIALNIAFMREYRLIVQINLISK